MTGDEVWMTIYRQQAETAVMMCGVVRPATIADRFRYIMAGAYEALIMSGQMRENPEYTVMYLELGRVIEESAGDKETIMTYLGKESVGNGT